MLKSWENIELESISFLSTVICSNENNLTLHLPELKATVAIVVYKIPGIISEMLEYLYLSEV